MAVDYSGGKKGKTGRAQSLNDYFSAEYFWQLPTFHIAETVLQRTASDFQVPFLLCTQHWRSLHTCWRISCELCGFLQYISNNIYTGYYLMRCINIYNTEQSFDHK